MPMVSPCFNAEESQPRNLAKLQALPLDSKIIYSQAKIKQFYLAMRGNVYVSFSGGKDSMALLHLVRSIYPEVPAVFFDTGLEFPEIRDHVKSVNSVAWLKPEMTFRQVIENKGYPVIGKECAHWVKLAQNGSPSGIRQMNAETRYGFKRYSFLVDAPFRVSEECCDVMKKRPAKRYHKESGRCPFIGTRADESRVRADKWEESGENNLDAAIPSSTPLSIWTEADVWAYIRRFGVPYSPIYDMGYSRTGCIFCMFGIMSDRERFLTLKATHPVQWAYCMRDREKGGLGMRGVLDYIGIPTGCEQTNLDEYEEDSE